MTEKYCSKCELKLPLENFYYSEKTDKYSNYCKIHHREYAAAYSAKKYVKGDDDMIKKCSVCGIEAETKDDKELLFDKYKSGCYKQYCKKYKCGETWFKIAYKNKVARLGGTTAMKREVNITRIRLLFRQWCDTGIFSDKLL